jgi:AhpD family alkylhydroperoxidase
MSAWPMSLLHAPSSLSRGERELIAAYVSALNDCAFCHHSHAAVASVTSVTKETWWRLRFVTRKRHRFPPR